MEPFKNFFVFQEETFELTKQKKQLLKNLIMTTLKNASLCVCVCVCVPGGGGGLGEDHPFLEFLNLSLYP